jgi:hypothetical protein
VVCGNPWTPWEGSTFSFNQSLDNISGQTKEKKRIAFCLETGNSENKGALSAISFSLTTATKKNKEQISMEKTQ